MHVYPLPFEGAYIIATDLHEDQRGNLYRGFCRETLSLGAKKHCIDQINVSRTNLRGCIRGMHFQKPPFAETKFIRCIEGSVFDVIVDLRKGSPTFLKWHGEELSSSNLRMMQVPEGFAHGFQALEAPSVLLYLHTRSYAPQHEAGIRYNDPLIGVKWPLEITLVSERDQEHPLLSNKFDGLEL